MTSTPPVVYLLLLLLLAALFAASPAVLFAASADPHPEALPSFKIREPQQEARGCSYTVKIKTSCSSPRYTRDQISIAFGDAYRNEVYIPRLDNPASHAFEHCSTDTFQVQGPCGYGVCYLYLQRNGWDGWVPELVKIYEVNYGRSLTFYYNTPLPNGVWYGFNHCTARAAGVANVTEATGNGLAAEM